MSADRGADRLPGPTYHFILTREGDLIPTGLISRGEAREKLMFLGLTTEQIARLSWQLGIGLRADERNLDRPVNTDPDAPGAEAPTLTAPATAPAMTLEELLGPEVEELIRVNKL